MSGRGVRAPAACRAQRPGAEALVHHACCLRRCTPHAPGKGTQRPKLFLRCCSDRHLLHIPACRCLSGTPANQGAAGRPMFKSSACRERSTRSSLLNATLPPAWLLMCCRATEPGEHHGMHAAACWAARCTSRVAGRSGHAPLPLPSTDILPCIPRMPPGQFGPKAGSPIACALLRGKCSPALYGPQNCPLAAKQITSALSFNRRLPAYTHAAMCALHPPVALLPCW